MCTKRNDLYYVFPPCRSALKYKSTYYRGHEKKISKMTHISVRLFGKTIV